MAFWFMLFVRMRFRSLFFFFLEVEQVRLTTDYFFVFLFSFSSPSPALFGFFPSLWFSFNSLSPSRRRLLIVAPAAGDRRLLQTGPLSS